MCVDTAGRLCSFEQSSNLRYFLKVMERFGLGNDFTLLFNFDFELVIIEDFSTDGTRDIVTDFQKKYPDKIRLVISWTRNTEISGTSPKLWEHAGSTAEDIGPDSTESRNWSN